ncbi:MAG: hypothetical protein JSR73_10805 [Proteobacteria bacterium]|nr:hypothetical protein [Pseudomonadota bacterium]
MLHRYTVITFFCLLAALFVPSADAASGRPVDWIIALRDAALQRGADATLPPHLSVMLELTREEHAMPVRQWARREGSTVHTFNIIRASDGAPILVVTDERAKTTRAYSLTSEGELKRAVVYGAGRRTEVVPVARAREGFRAERDYWAGLVTRPDSAPR